LHKACNEGIHLARGTSVEAFDGGGKMRRAGNGQIALFRNEKWYKCDLSASYNIGTRYWIREIINYAKSLTGNREVAGCGQMPDPVVPLRSALDLCQGGATLSQEAATIAAA